MAPYQGVLVPDLNYQHYKSAEEFKKIYLGKSLTPEQYTCPEEESHTMMYIMTLIVGVAVGAFAFHH